LTRVHIVAAKEHAVRQALETERGPQPVVWLYLGERVDTLESCEGWFAGRGIRREFGHELQETARTTKEAYIEYMGALSQRLDSVQWWLGSPAEKNPYVSKIYVRLCRILTVTRLLKAAGETSVVVTDEPSVKRILAEFLISQGVPVMVAKDPPATVVSERFATILSWFIRRIWFILHHGFRLIIARLLGGRLSVAGKGAQPDPRQGMVLLHGWVDERSFDATGRFRNINLGNLVQYLEDRGWSCRLVPMILPDVSYASTLRALLRSRTASLVPHAWLTLSDLCRALVVDLAVAGEQRQWPRFEGVDMGPLIEADIRQDWKVARVPTHFLNTLLVHRWRKHHVPVAGFAYSYENHSWERAFGLGFRQAYPEARLVGYQDANVPDLCLNFFISESERDHHSFPDAVVTNGGYSFDVLLRSGYPKERLRRGGALRFESSVRLAYHPPGPIGSKRNTAPIRRQVLVAAPYSQELAAELIWKAIHALGPEQDLRVVIKCHPVFPFSRISNALGGLRLPPQFEVSDRPFLDLLEESGVLLYMDSTTSVEGLARGVPIIHVGSDWSLDLDTIGLPCRERVKVRTPQELSVAVRDVLDMNGAKLEERQRQGRELVKTFFGPVGEAAYVPVAEALVAPGNPS